MSNSLRGSKEYPIQTFVPTELLSVSFGSLTPLPTRSPSFAIVLGCHLVITISLSLSSLDILVASHVRSQQEFHVVVQLIVFSLVFFIWHVLSGQPCPNVTSGHLKG